MTILPILIDSRPAYLRHGAGTKSLLLMPLGTGTVLSYLARWVAGAGGVEPIVLPVFEPAAEYEQQVHAAAGVPKITVVGARRLGEFLGKYEPSDWLLMVDPSYFVFDRLSAADFVRDAREPGCVKHVVALDRAAQGATECVQLDVDGRVKRIQRYYNGVTWLQTTGVACSLVPLVCTAAGAAVPFVPLAELRQTLASRGIPTSDVALREGVTDLTEERGLLGLNEKMMLEELTRPPATGRQTLAPNIRAGAKCEIHPTARLYGPVTLHDRVVVEEHAAVIGPAVLGEGSRVQANAVVAQAVLAPHTVVPESLAVRHRLYCGQDLLKPPPPAGDRPVCHSHLEAAADGDPQAFGGDPLRDERARHPHYPAVKRVIETLFAALGLLVLSPLLLIAAALVKLTSRGTVFFGHEREGLDGKIFRCWKFRTMVPNAHALQRALYEQNKVDGPQFKMARDPRVTTVGRFLRASNIDELPQLINVVRGEMSLIGPRPSPFRENQICVPWRQARLSVRPGITGLWQVCRHERAAGDFHQWIYYDMLYVRHMSFWLDVKILLATLATLGGRFRVPLSWLIPAHKLHDESQMSMISTWIPILNQPGKPNEPLSTAPSR